MVAERRDAVANIPLPILVVTDCPAHLTLLTGRGVGWHSSVGPKQLSVIAVHDVHLAAFAAVAQMVCQRFQGSNACVLRKSISHIANTKRELLHFLIPCIPSFVYPCPDVRL